MKVTINGEIREITESIRVVGLLAEMGIPADQKGIAIAVNDEVVPRSLWDQQELSANDQVEIVHAVQGG